MLNEGIIVNDTKALIKSTMVRTINNQGRMTPERWQESVFEAVTGEKVSEIDWSVEGNMDVYYHWTRSFDELIGELVDDGYVRAEMKGGQRTIVPLETDDPVDYSQLVHGR